MGNNKKTLGNILLVANYSSDVGYAWWLMETFWAAIARYFAQRGRKTLLIFPKITVLPERIMKSPIIPMELDFRDRSRSNISALHRLITDNAIRYIYLSDGKYYDPFYLRLRTWGVTSIINHDHTPGERSRPSPFRRWPKTLLHRLKILSCSHYIGVSRFVHDRLIVNACIPSNRCYYVLNGIEPIGRDPGLRNYARGQFGIPEDATIIVASARATFYKGIDFIIRCASVLLQEKKLKNLYFLHCGSGPDLDALKKMVVEYGIDSNFIFAGHRSDIRSILQSCDIGMQASQGEAFSLAILEYMSAGLATIVPNNCGNAEAIDDGNTGVLYRPGDLITACSHLERLIQNPGLRMQLGQAAMRAVIDRFTIDRATKELVDLMEQFC